MKAKNITKVLCAFLAVGMLLSSIGCAKNADVPNGLDSGVSTSSSNTDSSTSKNESTKKETTKKETIKETVKKVTTTDRIFTLNTTNRWTTTTDSRNGVKIRTVTIDTGWGGESVKISQLSDIHINYCTSNDLKDPVLYSTYQNRTWLKNFGSRPNLENTMMIAKDSDLVVLTGDVYDYYAEGVVQKTDEYIFDKYDNVVACIGNHEQERQMQGTVADTMPLEDRRQLVSSTWCNDIVYDSYVLKDKVMVVLLDNSLVQFLEEQVELLKADLQKARNNGYAVLLFYHIPLDTGNPNFPEFYGRGDLPGLSSTGGDRAVYDLICTNGDIIKGCFCGHFHADSYSEILATTPSGEATVIPQYVLTSLAYDKGHMLNIIVK